MMNKIRYIFAQCNQGQKKKGVENIQKYFNPLCKNETEILNIHNVKFNTTKGYSILEDYVFHCHNKGYFPFVIGGDHSISIGSLAGSLKYHQGELTTIWVDAHADINTIDSSSTKNLHGMPLSILTGLEKDVYKLKEENRLDFKNLIYFGLRDIDEYEKNIIQEKNIRHLTSLELNNDVSLNTVGKIHTENIHLSLDVDVLDPLFMTSTGTCVENGINMKKLDEILRWIEKSGKVVSIDLVEFNHSIGKKSEKTQSYYNVCRIMHMLHKYFVK